jgi:hypothetical protein
MKKLNVLLSTTSHDQAGPVSSEEIALFEKELGLKFGKEYKAFLMKFGCLVVGSKEIYGICGKNDSIPSAIHATRSARRDRRFPRDLVVIAGDGSGKMFCVDASDRVVEVDRSAFSIRTDRFAEFAASWLSK